MVTVLPNMVTHTVTFQSMDTHTVTCFIKATTRYMQAAFQIRLPAGAGVWRRDGVEGVTGVRPISCHVFSLAHIQMVILRQADSKVIAAISKYSLVLVVS